MKKVVLLLLSVCLVGFIVGCDDGGGTPGIYEPYTGELLSVDGAGIFPEEVKYEWDDGSYNLFRADGTFETIDYEYEYSGDDEDEDGITGEGKVQTGGERGTYTYDPVTYELVKIRTSGFDTDPENYGWEVFDGYFCTDTEVALLTEHQYRRLYKFKETGVWASVNTSVWSWTEDDGTTGANHHTYTKTYSITADTFVSERKWDLEWVRDGVVTTTGTEHTYTETASILNANPSAAIGDGEYITVQILWETCVDRDWEFNWDTGEFLDQPVVTDEPVEPNDTRSYSFLGVGEYIMEVDSQWIRSMR